MSGKDDAFMAWADSISDITGIAYGPYFYDPSWPVLYSEDGTELTYFPRDTAATHFDIPGCVCAIGDRAFQGNSHLEEMVIPISICTIGAHSFHCCSALRKVVIQGTLERIPWNAFSGCLRLKEVDLPATVKFIDGFAFTGCDSLRTFVVRAAEPPILTMDGDLDDPDVIWAFSAADLSRCMLRVPEGSVEAYRQASGWNRFNDIREIH